MSSLVAALRLASVALATFLGCACLLLGSTVLWPFPGALWRWRNFMVADWARTVTGIIGMRISVQGVPSHASGILVANHLSYLDIPLLFTQLGCIFVAKAELGDWPVLGFLMRSVNTVFIDRSRKRDIPRVNAMIERALRNNRLVIVFPEGTSSPGNEVLPLKSSLLQYPAQAQLPVSYATIRYATCETDAPAHLSVCWWGEMTFPDHVFNLLKLRRIDAMLQFGKAPVQSADRKELAHALWLQMRKQFVPTMISRVPDSSVALETAELQLEA